MTDAAGTTGETRGPTISFLMTAYRTEDVVGRAIGSVLDQTVADWELVVVDNGRSDAMAAVVSPFTVDPRVTLVRQENRGPAGGIAAAASRATGRWFVVLNSDDHVAPEFARRMLDVVAAHPGVSAVTCDAERFNDTGPPVSGSYLEAAGQSAPVTPDRPLRPADVIDGPCPFYAALIRRDVWEAYGGMASLRDDTTLINDLDFWLRILTDSHEVRTLPDRLGYYRIEPGSSSRPEDDVRAEQLADEIEASLRRAAERTGAPEDRAALDRSLARLHHGRAVRRGRAALASGSPSEAAERYREALRLHRTTRVAAVAAALRVAPRLTTMLYRSRRRRAGRGRA